MQNTEVKVRGKELETVWDDTNEWNEETVWKTCSISSKTEGSESAQIA